MAIAIIVCAVVAYLILVCLFIRYKALGAANSKRCQVIWIIASVVLGPLVWPVWWLTHRCAAKTPTSEYPQESFSLSDPLKSKPSAPFIDDDDDSPFFHADARSGGPAAARPSAAAASSIFKPPPPPAPRFDAAAHVPAACPVAGGAAAGAASSFHQAMAQPAPAMDRVPDEMTDQ
jgi:hypothetical protein